MLCIQKQGPDSSQINYFRALAAFQNPEFYKAQAMRLSTHGIPRIIDCSEETPDYLALPRGCQDEVIELLNGHNTEILIDDSRNRGSKINVEFMGQLREEQRSAVEQLAKWDIGSGIYWGNRFGCFTEDEYHESTSTPRTLGQAGA